MNNHLRIYLQGTASWPGILLGAFVANVTTAGTAATSLGIAVGNTLEGLVGAYLINRFAHGRQTFERAADIFRFAILAGVVSTAVSATSGVTTLALGGFADWAQYGSIWFTWWLGDMIGALVVTPFLVLWSLKPRVDWNRAQTVEALVTLLCLLAVSLIVFAGLASPYITSEPLEYLCILPILWAAFRLGPREAITGTVLLSGIAIVGTLNGLGPFASPDANQSLLLLQAFTGIVAVMAVTLAAVVSEHKRVALALAEESEQRAAIALDKARLYREAQAALQARDQFLSLGSHEIKTPLAIIQGYVGLIQLDLEQRLDVDGNVLLERKRLEHQIGNIDQAIGRLTALINDLLDVSRLQGGHLSINPERVELVEIVRKTVEKLELDARRTISSKPRIQLQLSTDTCIWGMWDRGRIEQVIINLVENGLKYSGREGVIQVSLAVEPNNHQGADWQAHLVVRDDGIGIPAGELERIFLPFLRSSNAIDSKLEGIGVGLAISKDIVEQHRGRIWAESDGVGEGSAFHVILPIVARS